MSDLGKGFASPQSGLSHCSPSDIGFINFGCSEVRSELLIMKD